MSSNFIHGVIVYNIPSTQDEGVVCTRRLATSNSQGLEVKFFDRTYPITDDLRPRKNARLFSVSCFLPIPFVISLFLILMFLPSQMGGGKEPSARSTGLLEFSSYWKMSDEFADPESRRVIVETLYGDILLSYWGLENVVLSQGGGESDIMVDGIVQWDPVRFDVEAILK